MQPLELAALRQGGKIAVVEIFQADQHKARRALRSVVNGADGQRRHATVDAGEIHRLLRRGAQQRAG